MDILGQGSGVDGLTALSSDEVAQQYQGPGSEHFVHCGPQSVPHSVTQYATTGVYTHTCTHIHMNLYTNRLIHNHFMFMYTHVHIHTCTLFSINSSNLVLKCEVCGVDCPLCEVFRHFL